MKHIGYTLIGISSATFIIQMSRIFTPVSKLIFAVFAILAVLYLISLTAAHYSNIQAKNLLLARGLFTLTILATGVVLAWL
ncbi:MAG: hypothetical protein SAL07_25235 [Oscillatoria sp. PMC 1051.18]|nr:hypothetical protein [Oscillatoria sp. PMC 1050.18]MEC5033211.1 hypothetical protein [Oscillatoria sp. PMC 1051.18]